MSLDSLRAEAFSKLLLSYVIVDSQGTTIDEGETFSVQFEVLNRFPPSALPNDQGARSHARFTNLRLSLEGTAYASVVGGDRTISVGGALNAGRVVVTEPVQFLALRAIEPPGLDLTIREPFVRAVLTAEFDIDRFFRVRTGGLFTADIQPD